VPARRSTSPSKRPAIARSRRIFAQSLLAKPGAALVDPQDRRAGSRGLQPGCTRAFRSSPTRIPVGRAARALVTRAGQSGVFACAMGWRRSFRCRRYRRGDIGRTARHRRSWMQVAVTAWSGSTTATASRHALMRGNLAGRIAAYFLTSKLTPVIVLAVCAGTDRDLRTPRQENPQITMRPRRS